ncbi:metallophosphoesterase family protein [Streptomyces sp. TR06-5]|uniref:metallophosphoesterase family protein n=1 Tax=Streptomyces sp. TR06-5 TaxID=3385976 RepID=UPI0039A2C9A2
MEHGRASLLAISDLHVRHRENREILDGLRPHSERDWLLVAGDVGETFDDIVRTMELLSRRFARVVWVPGNHELWTVPNDPVQLRGEERYRHLVDTLRGLDVLTPEDPYPVWEGLGGPVAVVPMFLLYDYTFRPPGTHSKDEALEAAYDAGVVATDEFLLHHEPHAGRDGWCRSRLAYTRDRLERLDPDLPTVLVNHFPLVREPTRVLHYPEFALWCGTEATADWHVRYRAAAVVHGHLHIPRTLVHDGVPHQEVSLGYPREWRSRPAPPAGLHRVLPRGERA